MILLLAGMNSGATSRAVKALVGLVKSRGVRVRPEAISTLLSLPLTTATATRGPKARKPKGTVGAEDSEDGETLGADGAPSRAAEYAATLKDLLHIYFRLLRSKGWFVSAEAAVTCLVCMVVFAFEGPVFSVFL
jgi:hypothetical protein